MHVALVVLLLLASAGQSVQTSPCAVQAAAPKAGGGLLGELRQVLKLAIPTVFDLVATVGSRGVV